MSVVDAVLAAGLVAVLFLGGVVSSMLKREAESWLGALPVLLIKAARQRVPRGVRSDLYEEWVAELHEEVHGTEDRPVSRLLRSLSFSWGIFRTAASIGRDLEGIRDDRPDVTPVTAQFEIALPYARITPVTYREARQVGDCYRAGNDVLLDLTEIDDDLAKRLVDFAAGLAFGVGGHMARVANRQFLLAQRPDAPQGETAAT